jgi:hypothetical protein
MQSVDHRLCKVHRSAEWGENTTFTPATPLADPRIMGVSSGASLLLAR